MAEHEFRRNSMLARLPDAEFSALQPKLRLERSEMKQSAYEPGKPIANIYFPLTSVYSLVAVADGRITLEVATIGYEGMVGLPVFLGAASSPQAAYCHVGGDSVRVSAQHFREALNRGGTLHSLLNRFTQAMMVQLAQNAACSRSHSTVARMARWLATTQDRVGRDQFPLTQEFIAQMLGVHRPTVSDTAQRMQAEGLIRYSRGIITIADRAELERRACDCYRIVKAEFDDMSSSGR